MTGQIDMFSYMDQKTENVNLLPFLAVGLKEYCKEWHYDWMEQLQENKTTEGFIKLFCRLTRFFFFKYNNERYGAEIVKEERKIKMYKCGIDCRNILQEASIDNLILRL